MNFPLRWWLLILVSHCLCAQAIEAQATLDKEPKGQPILYKRALPQVALRLMPRSAKSLFWGTFTPNGTKTPVAIHLMRLKPQSWELVDGSKSLFRHYSLDLFTKSDKRWQHLTSTPLAYRTLFEDRDNFTYAASFYWVDAKTKKIPLLRFHVFYKDGGYGPIGEALFVSFAKGWPLPPAIQSFKFGEWFSSDSIGQSNEVERDKDGMARIVSSLFPASDSGSERLLFTWDAKRGRFWPDTATQELFKPPEAPLDSYFSL